MAALRIVKLYELERSLFRYIPRSVIKFMHIILKLWDFYLAFIRHGEGRLSRILSHFASD